MARDFYPFVEKAKEELVAGEVTTTARIAVYDDAAAAPRVVVIEGSDVRSFLEEITATVNKLSHEQGGNIPFMVIREIVENFIHAYFQAPTITILDGGNTIRFSDQGPGIKEKKLALEYGTSSATEEMKRYIRGVGSGLPYAQQYMQDKGGSLEIEDNISGGTIVTISTRRASEAREVAGVGRGDGQDTGIPAAQMGAAMPAAQGFSPAAGGMEQPVYQQGYAQPQLGMGAYQPQWAGQATPGAGYQGGYPATYSGVFQPSNQGGYQGGYYQPQGWPAQGMPQQQAQQQPQQPAYPQMPAQAPGFASEPQPQQQPAGPALTQRQQQVMEFLAAHETCGPTELTQAYGSSGPTWSRELKALVDTGLITKAGQKYRLTTIGRSFI